MIPTREQINAYPYFGDTSKTWLRAMRDEIDRLTAANEAGGAALLDAQREAAKLRAELAALKPSDPDAKLRELLAWIVDKARMHLREGHGWSFETGHINIASVVVRIDEMLAQTAPVEQPSAAVPDHFPDAGKMVPVLYWLEDGKFARAMLVGKDLLVVDLTFGDGPSVVGRPEWFDAGYVAAYGGLVPESATRGKEPGQWDYGVASIAKPSAVPDDTRELVAQLAEHVVTMCDGMDFGVALSEVQAIAAKLRGWA